MNLPVLISSNAFFGTPRDSDKFSKTTMTKLTKHRRKHKHRLDLREIGGQEKVDN